MKTTIVTGASSGIGRAIARILGEGGHHIIAAGRSEQRTAPVAAEIEDSGGSAEFLHLDLSSFDHVRTAAGDLLARGRQLDVVINNAGVGIARGSTADGFEPRFGINHLGHFLLNRLIWDAFREGTRIVTVASSAHFRVDGIDWDRVAKPAWAPIGLDLYAVSKLANILYTTELARLKPEWRTYAAHPGLVNTKILPGFVRWLRGDRMQTPEQGARTPVFCATDPGLANESGGYYARGERATPSRAARDDGLARELWDRSERWCGLDADL